MDKGKTLAVIYGQQRNRTTLQSFDLIQWTWTIIAVSLSTLIRWKQFISIHHTRFFLGDKRAEVWWVMEYSKVLVTLSESLLSPSANNGTCTTSVKSKYCPVSEIISSSQHFPFLAVSVEILECEKTCKCTFLLWTKIVVINYRA